MTQYDTNQNQYYTNQNDLLVKQTVKGVSSLIGNYSPFLEAMWKPAKTKKQSHDFFRQSFENDSITGQLTLNHGGK